MRFREGESPPFRVNQRLQELTHRIHLRRQFQPLTSRQGRDDPSHLLAKERDVLGANDRAHALDVVSVFKEFSHLGHSCDQRRKDLAPLREQLGPPLTGFGFDSTSACQKLGDQNGSRLSLNARTASSKSSWNTCTGS